MQRFLKSVHCTIRSQMIEVGALGSSPSVTTTSGKEKRQRSIPRRTNSRVGTSIIQPRKRVGACLGWWLLGIIVLERAVLSIGTLIRRFRKLAQRSKQEISRLWRMGCKALWDDERMHQSVIQDSETARWRGDTEAKSLQRLAKVLWNWKPSEDRDLHINKPAVQMHWVHRYAWIDRRGDAVPVWHWWCHSCFCQSCGSDLCFLWSDLSSNLQEDVWHSPTVELWFNHSKENAILSVRSLYGSLWTGCQMQDQSGYSCQRERSLQTSCSDYSEPLVTLSAPTKLHSDQYLTANALSKWRRAWWTWGYLYGIGSGERKNGLFSSGQTDSRLWLPWFRRHWTVRIKTLIAFECSWLTRCIETGKTRSRTEGDGLSPF